MLMTDIVFCFGAVLVTIQQDKGSPYITWILCTVQIQLQVALQEKSDNIAQPGDVHVLPVYRSE